MLTVLFCFSTNAKATKIFNESSGCIATLDNKYSPPPCVENAGTFSVAIDGVNQGSSCGTFNLNSGSEITWTSNGDQILASGANAGIVFIIFDSDPSGLNLNDPATFTGGFGSSVLGGDPDNTAPYTTQETSCAGLSGTNSTWPSTIWVVPVTADFASIPYTIDTDFDGCVDAGCITQINYVYTLPTYTCGDIFVDNGGATGTYCPDSDPTTTNWLICPDTPGGVVTLNFTDWDVESFGAFGGDQMTIYDGDNNGAPLIGNYSGFFGSPGIITSTAASGCLYIEFESDGSVEFDGWMATISCGTPPPPPCECSNPVCGGMHWDCASDAQFDYDFGFPSAAEYTLPTPLSTAVGTTHELCWQYTTGPTQTSIGFVNAIGNSTGSAPGCSFTRSYHVYQACGSELTNIGPASFGTDGLEYTVSPNTSYQFCVDITYTGAGCGDLQENFVWLYNPSGAGGCGTCATPCTDPGMGNVATYPDRTYLSCWEPDCDIYGPGAFTNCFTANADNTGFLGFANQIQNSLPGCINISWELTAAGNCGSVIANPVPNANGVGSGFNPEYTGLTPNGSYTLCVTYTLPDFLCGFDGGAFPDFICIDSYGTNCTATLTGTSMDGSSCQGDGIPLSTTTSWVETSSSGSVFTGFLVFCNPPVLPMTETYYNTNGLSVILETTDVIGSLINSSGQFVNPLDPSETCNNEIYLVPITIASSGPGGFVIDWQCFDTESVINVDLGIPPPAMATASPMTICSGESSTLTASGGGTYVWDNGLGTNPVVSVMPTVTTTYTVTVTDADGNCSSTAQVTVNVDAPSDPIFAGVGPYCSGEAIPALPTTSTNGVNGTWSPSIDNTTTTTYTFTPAAGQCANTTTLTITIDAPAAPTFAGVGPYCSGEAIPALPTTSTNGVNGTWSPSIDNTTTTTYTFTPTAGQCANTTTLTITIDAPAAPTFAGVGPYCSGEAIPALPTTSTNGVNGTWSPSIDNTTTTTYTFTPTAGQCANTTTLTIDITSLSLPSFSINDLYCVGDMPDVLPLISDNGVTGLWNPAVISTSNSGITNYTFTPSGPGCFDQLVLSVQVDACGCTNPAMVSINQVVDICAGEQVNLTALLAGSATSLTWSSGGDGSFDNATALTPIYTPGAIDISTGSVLFSVITDDPDGSGPCTSAVADLTVLINSPVDPLFATVGPYCIGESIPALPINSTNGVTGTWSPAIDNTSTTTYTFSPNTGECANTTTLTIVIATPTDPTFAPVGPYCSGQSVPDLPLISNEGISGTWSPAINNMATTVYTFTPAPGQCANTTTLSIVIDTPIDPTFTAVGPFCSGETIPNLPTTSLNGVNGSWSPTLNNMVSTLYTFTPNVGECANTSSLTIAIDAQADPVFSPVGPYCEGEVIPPLPTTSENGISGIWSPAIDNTVTTSYTFNPNSGECANSVMFTIDITPLSTPVFNITDTYCVGDSPDILSLVSDDGVNGTWSPAAISTVNSGVSNYTFTPSDPGCFDQVMLSIQVDACGCANPASVSIDPIATLCAGENISLNALLGGSATMITWSSAGDGSFDDNFSLTPIYNPGPADIANGSVMLSVITDDPDGSGSCTPAVADIALVIDLLDDPEFISVGPYCSNEIIPDLPTTSLNGISGTWSPSINNTTTSTYTFTPDFDECANTTTMTIIIDVPVQAIFTNVGPYCSGDMIPALPTISDNGVTGTWSPAIDNTATTTYTFTPSIGECANTASLTIEVIAPISPNFMLVDAYCVGDTPEILPLSSTNGINGTWNPAAISTANSGTSNYTFTPSDPGCFNPVMLSIQVDACGCSDPAFVTINPVDNVCEGEEVNLNAMLSGSATTATWSSAGDGVFDNNSSINPIYTPGPNDIANGSVLLSVITDDPDGTGSCTAAVADVTLTIDELLDPNFMAVGPYCSGEMIPELLLTSTNGINGTWSPSIDNMVTTSYTFTPDSGICANETTLTIEINPSLTPVFSVMDTYCVGDMPELLETVSDNGVSGTWNPSVISTVNSGISNYTFTPSDPNCTDQLILSIQVDACGCADPASVTISPITDICVGQMIDLNAILGGSATSLSWSSTGDGSFDNALSENTIYTPGPLDINNGMVTFSVVTNDPDGMGPCTSAINDISVVISPQGQTLFNLVMEYCVGENTMDLPSISDNGVMGTWMPSVISTSIVGATTYEFTPSDIFCNENFSVTIDVIDCGCTDPAMVSIDPVSAICENELIDLVANLGGAATSVTWTTNGDGSFNDFQMLNTQYTPGPSDIANGSVLLSIITDDPDGSDPCSAAMQEINVLINSQVTPDFIEVGPFCAGTVIPDLATTSINGINGTWSPAINNMITTSYTFTPDNGACATIASLTIVVDDCDCMILADQISAAICDDSGTPNDNSDDTYTFDVLISSDQGSSWTANDPNATNGNYGEIVSFGPFLISDGDVSFLIVDNDDMDCNVVINVVAPMACSEPICELAVDVISLNPECFAEENGLIDLIIANAQGNIQIVLNGGTVSETPISNLGAGSYDISISDDLCQIDTLISLVFPPEINIDLGVDLEIALGDTVQLNASTDVQMPIFQWSNGNSLSCNDCSNPLAYPSSDISYTVSVTDENGCEATDIININVDDSFDIYFPNVFNPGSRSGNATFGPMAGEDYIINSFRVYDRWGELVFESIASSIRATDNFWDGTFKGKYAVPGVYVYSAEIQNNIGQIKTFVGDITLLR